MINRHHRLSFQRCLRFLCLASLLTACLTFTPNVILRKSISYKHLTHSPPLYRVRSNVVVVTSNYGNSEESKSVSNVIKVLDKLTIGFPFWVIAAAITGVLRPKFYTWITPRYNTIAIALSMVCMGMTLTPKDFQDIIAQPKPVAIGTALQYTIMPFMGFMAAKLFRLSPALAAGVCLVGSCPGGTASNLVSLIAGADVALSVLLTAASTALATIMTPLMIKLLVGGIVEVSGKQLIISTAQIIIAPVTLGLLLSMKAKKFTEQISPYTPFACVLLVACVCGSGVAQNSASVLSSGGRLFGAVSLMHVGGYSLGYFVSKLAGFREKSSRTVGIEVGMQNAGLSVVLARRAFPDPLTALPGAISAVIASVMGSVLAVYWQTKDRKQSS